MNSILLFGSGGQLGTTLLSELHGSAWEVLTAPRAIRLENREAVRDLIHDVRPRWIINAAAMTDVDLAHDESLDAFCVNALAPGSIALCATEVGSRLIHISSEAVYKGDRETKYREQDSCDPVSVYGTSKLAGDLLVRTYSPDSYVLRTSWLYSGHSGTNFPTRIVNRLEASSQPVSVVTDIVGNPTPTYLLGDAMKQIMQSTPEPDVYNVCCEGTASKYEWAQAIAARAGHDMSRIKPITSDAYPTVARRPKHVDLDCGKFLKLGLMPLPEWREAWSTTLARL